jgi:hypothetical protein
VIVVAEATIFELALGQVAEDRRERGVLEFDFAADLFADRFDHFDVEALEFGLRLAEFLEWRIRHV